VEGSLGKLIDGRFDHPLPLFIGQVEKGVLGQRYHPSSM
jgi:hypothetical protein